MTKFEKKFIKIQFGSKQRLSLYNKLIKFLKNGVSLPQALDIMWSYSSENGKKKKSSQAVILDDLRQKVRDGSTFGKAISVWVPDGDVTVIASGELAGNLIVALENAVFIQEGGKKIRSAIVAGVAYPILLVAVLIGFMYIVSSRVVPAFEEIIPKETFTGTGAGLAIMADIVNDYMNFFLGLIVISTVMIIIALPRWKGKIRVRFDSLPPFSLYRLSVGAGFLLSMSAMIKAGVSIPKALKIMRKNATPWYRERIDGALSFVANGKNFGEALYMTGHRFPDRETVADLRAYASLDGFDETLEKLGSDWMEESIEKINQQSAILKNAAFIILGITFMWIASGIFSLQQQVASGL